MRIAVSMSNANAEAKIKSAVNMFAPEAYADLIPLKYASPDRVILMKITDFLRMAKRIAGGPKSKEKANGVRNLVETGVKFNSLPYLRTEPVEGKDWDVVVGHEGRHRSMHLQSMGYTHIPVVIKAKHPWSHQESPELDEYRDTWPTRLRGQNGHLMPYPVPRSESASTPVIR